ncbi:hypothetical protein ABIC28_001194 [Rhodococcus sp. PvR044]|jgi:hypothetical protein|uniref:hypothetical protein n=1 Tax=Rhodococcus TaxID=1827 RepID=UPI000BD23AFB|nr:MULTISPECIES: hypothetical protein [Rhodococcus]MBP1158425.1 hypothetical protein [Rhodococcus sp. PvR099]MCZ4554015.1 hypothetical protein [Rhodococcus maanshanensis]PTR43851.1 hypothetical protein C8K38_106204 [Rhodococcus sp. OK611]SNX90669.1 hypothetical protein SAMN05447004_106204 [Rhodococcus sp. OK270]
MTTEDRRHDHPDTVVFGNTREIADRIMALPDRVVRALTVAKDRCAHGSLRLQIFHNLYNPELGIGRYLFVPGDDTEPHWVETLDGTVTLRCPCCQDEVAKVGDVVERFRNARHKR